MGLPSAAGVVKGVACAGSRLLLRLGRFVVVIDFGARDGTSGHVLFDPKEFLQDGGDYLRDRIEEKKRMRIFSI